MQSSLTSRPSYIQQIKEAVKFPVLLRRVSGHSMEPTFIEGQVVVGHTHRRPRRNDIVIARIDDRIEVIKRIVDMRFGLIYLAGDNEGHTKKYSVMPQDIIAVVRT